MAKKSKSKDAFTRSKVSASPGELFDPTSGYGRSMRQPGSQSWEEYLASQGITGKKARNDLTKRQTTALEQQWEQAGGGKKMDWLLTEAGRNFATNEPEAYMNALMARAGGMSGAAPYVGGPTQFGQYLAGDYQDQLNTGYDAALMASGGRLGRADYLNSVGWGARANQNALNLPMQPPTDTGNPFTSTSMPSPGVSTAPGGGGIPEAPTWKDFLAQHDMTKKTFEKDLFKEDQKELRTTFRNPNAALSTTGGGVDHARRAYLSLTPQQRGINSATGFKPGRWAVF